MKQAFFQIYSDSNSWLSLTKVLDYVLSEIKYVFEM